MQIIQDRRALHRIPELGSQLPLTMQYIKQLLEGLNCTVFEPAEGSLCAWFDFGANTAIAFRADADALPIAEKTGLEFASQHPGQMHACGHDGHMAILLELARRLSGRQNMKKNILLVFQCAEETTGGALAICKSGVFERYAVEAIFGLHLWPGLAEGVIASRKNELMARSCELHVTVTGRSVHIAKAEQGMDALAAGVAFYTKVMELERKLPKGIFHVLNFGKMESGTVCNAISGKTVLEGSLRAFQDEIFEDLRGRIRQAGREVEQATGCTVEITMTDGYPAVMNPSALYDRVRSIVPFSELEVPSMTAEDFSWYQRYLPGMFFFLGAGNTPALHSSNFDFNEQILSKGADFFEHLALCF